MPSFLSSMFWFVITLSILVTIHEFGHFWVARKLGVKVLRFSVGFGNALWRRMGADGTEYVIASIPLGGYVKFLDEREGEVAPNEVHRAFNRADLWRRTLIVLAGPVANFVFAVFAFWLVAVIGKSDFPALLDQPSGIAAQAGFKVNDQVLAVDGTPVSGLSEANYAIILAALDRRDVVIRVREADQDEVDRVAAFSKLSSNLSEEKVIEQAGLRFFILKIKPEIAELTPGSPAALAGLKPKDEIVAINDIATPDQRQLQEIIQTEARRNPELRVTIQRGGSTFVQTIRAKEDVSNPKDKRFRLGFAMTGPSKEQVLKARNAVERYGPLQAIPVAFRKTWNAVEDIGLVIKNLFVGHLSPKMLSGPIGIAQMADISADEGYSWFIGFLALLSVNLGLVNLLPVPVLDGGHLMYYLIEWVKGGPLSERLLIAGQYVGLALLGALMILVFYNDIFRLVTS